MNIRVKQKNKKTIMKRYIKPNTEMVTVKIQSLLTPNSVTGLSGLDGVYVSKDVFSGGAADSRSSIWGDDEEDFEE